MEEIRIYHSIWKSALVMVGCVAFTVIGIHMLHHENSDWRAWLGILFFGLGGLFYLWFFLKERLTQKPFIIVTDSRLIMNSVKKYDVDFRDVKAFYLTKVGTVNMIGAQSKTNKKRYKPFSVDGLTMKPKELCDLLNQRLNRKP